MGRGEGGRVWCDLFVICCVFCVFLGGVVACVFGELVNVFFSVAIGWFLCFVLAVGVVCWWLFVLFGGVVACIFGDLFGVLFGGV